MKKITLIPLLLIYGITLGQTILFNYDTVNPDFEFCFDSPDPDQCTSTREVNNDTSGDNPSANYWQSIAPSMGGAFEYGLGVDFSSLNPQPTVNNDGAFLTIAFRSDQNPSGNLSITAQLWANDSDKIDAFSAYSRTDGSWETITFDYSGSTPQGAFDNDTAILRINFFIDSGAANSYTYGIDEGVLSTTLSLQSFNSKEEITIWPIPTQDILYINSRFYGKKVEVYNVLGNMIFDKKITVDENNIDVSALESGIYFIIIDNENMKRFVKS